MQIILELSTEEGQFQVLFILFLVFLSVGKYIFKQIYPLTPLMEILYAFTNLSIKLSLSRDIFKP